ncbi:MAG TPA: hypothetical protein VN602_13680 [Gemmatimonadaceae bacterium]|nr:hypothetical protein [Gemmatimonadaceae bacterium]
MNRDKENQMRMKAVALALGLMCLGGAAACSRASSSGAGGAAAPAEVTTLKVDNQGSLDMDVYVVRVPAGQRIRLGTATAATVTKMTIPSDVLIGANTSLRFIADPIGGLRPSVSSSILVTRGDEVTLQIPPR